MKYRLLDILLCPDCEGWLACEARSSAKVSYPGTLEFPTCRERCVFLNREASSVQPSQCRECHRVEILEGILRCEKCGKSYDIVRGIPRFVPQELSPVVSRSRMSFEAQYRTFPLLPKEEWERHYQSYVSVLPNSIMTGADKMGLDAGCGSGRTITIAARYCREIVGFDITDGVEMAYDCNRDNPNAHFIQADIYHLPFRKEYFDLIYSFGVIHHLPYPEQGFRSLLEFLKSRGSISIYVYRKYDDYFHEVSIRLISMARSITSRMPPLFLSRLCLLCVPIVYAAFVLPRKILESFRISRKFTAKIPFAQTVKMKYIGGQLFDRFSPPIEYRYDSQEVVDWFKRAGLENIGNAELFGHVVWGVKK